MEMMAPMKMMNLVRMESCLDNVLIIFFRLLETAYLLFVFMKEGGGVVLFQE